MLYRIIGIIGVLVAVSTVQAAGQGPVRKWWADREVQTALDLTAQQADQVEAIFQSTLPQLRSAKDELDRQEAELSRLIAADTTDESLIAQQIDRVEAARSEMSKLRALMLFRMHRVLSADQRAKLKAYSERRNHERRGRDADPRRR
jgi:Spy/CpxP family protein refolding chaperone